MRFCFSNMIFLVIPLLIACVNGAEIDFDEEVIRENNDFGISFYQEMIKETKGNIALSPFSAEKILTLVYLGAAGETANQIKSALRLNISDDEIKEAFKTITTNMKNVRGIDIEIANRAYLADGIGIESKFINTATEYFNSGVENVNFKSSKQTAEKINSWVEKQTNNKIKDIISEKELDELTRFILVNSLYFRGNWKHPFDKDATKQADFFKTKDESVKVDMMETTGHFTVFRNPEFKVRILILPYENTKAELCIFLPDEIDGLSLVEKNVKKIWSTRNYTTTYMKVYLPKFRIESTIDMIPALKNMGIQNLFSIAVLSGITKEQVYVSAINQKTFVDVNELGTEAASATAVHGGIRMLPIPNEKAEIFRADHPFSFVILYKNVGLMAGRVSHL